MISTTPTLTNAGNNLLTRAISGESLTFTRFKIGNGSLSASQTEASLTDLINSVLEFSITATDATQTGYIKVTGSFDSTDISSDFQFRELGLFAKGNDNVERLYAYVNDGDNAGILKANSSNVAAEQQISLLVAIGTATNVTATLLSGALYAPKTDFDSHVANTANPHGVTKTQVGLSEVPNVSTNNQTPTYSVASSLTALSSGEKISTALGKLSKAVASLISHLANVSNPHSVTRAQIGAAAASHNHNASDINSGVLSVTRGGTGVADISQLADLLKPEVFDLTGTESTNVNNCTDMGVYWVNYNATNKPTGASGGICFVVKTGSKARLQIYYDMSSRALHHRTRPDVSPYSWTSWD